MIGSVAGQLCTGDGAGRICMAAKSGHSSVVASDIQELAGWNRCRRGASGAEQRRLRPEMLCTAFSLSHRGPPSNESTAQEIIQFRVQGREKARLTVPRLFTDGGPSSRESRLLLVMLLRVFSWSAGQMASHCCFDSTGTVCLTVDDGGLELSNPGQRPAPCRRRELLLGMVFQEATTIRQH